MIAWLGDDVTNRINDVSDSRYIIIPIALTIAIGIVSLVFSIDETYMTDEINY